MPKSERTLIDALHAIRGTGRFHSAGALPFVFPGLRLRAGEELAFPLPRSQAGAIKAKAEPAPYGKGTATLRDDSVRKCWQLDAADFTWAQPEWDEVVAGVVSSVARDLGVDGQVVAEPYKMLLYEKGGFFLPHRDTEKLGAMFATLIVALPSIHKGGQLVVRHEGREAIVDFSKEQGRKQIQYAAFFADCEHEVKPVTSGHRLCLVYNLALKKGDPSSLNLAVTDQAARLVPLLEVLKASGGAGLSAILLEHRYTPANLSLRGLKNHDRARAEALFAAAEKAGFVAHLALVSLYQMGELEGDYDYGYSRYGRSSPGGKGEMGELYEETLSIDEWRGANDRRAALGCFRIHKTAIISREPIGAGDPDEEEEEGYTGNAGCTMEYWYHRAAIVVWPKDAHERVLTRYDFDAACERLLKMAARKGAAAKPGFLALGHAAIEEAEGMLKNDTDYAISCVRDRAQPILAAACVSGSEELFGRSKRKLLPHLLSGCDAKLWGKLFAAFGHGPCVDFLAGTSGDHIGARRDALLSALSAMLAAKSVAEEAAALAERLPELLRAPEPGARYGASTPGNLTAEKRLHIALAASFLIRDASKRDELRAIALGGSSLAHLRKVLAPALQSTNHRRHHRHSNSNSLFPESLAAAIGLLEAEVATKLEPYPDWKRPFPRSGSPRKPGGELFVELAEFMADPAAETHRFKRIQHERSALEDYIRSAGLDLDRRTEKKGSPHTLVCTKNAKSYASALKRRAEDEELLRRLRALGED